MPCKFLGTRHCTKSNVVNTAASNHFLTSPGYDDSNNLDVLVAAGLMTRGKAPAFCSEDEVVYRDTDEGKQFALDKLPPPTSGQAHQVRCLPRRVRVLRQLRSLPRHQPNALSAARRVERSRIPDGPIPPREHVPPVQAPLQLRPVVALRDAWTWRT